MATRSMNKVFLLGNLTRDPELRYTTKGTAICTFGVATNREWSPADSDQTQEETEFHNVVAWGKLAELCAQLLFKGRKVFIEGRLNTHSWDDPETGKKTFRTEVVCREMIALDVPRSVREARGESNYSRESVSKTGKTPVKEEPKAKASKAAAKPAEEKAAEVEQAD